MARIRQKLDRADWAKLSQDMQALYVERNGTFFLDSDEADELRAAFDRTKGDLTEARRRLDAMQDVDPVEYQRLKTAAEQAARDKELEAGNFKKLEEQQRATHLAELKKREDHAAALRGQLEESIVDGELVRAISTKYPGAKVTPLILGAKQSVKAMEIGGKLRAVVLDDKGEPRLKSGAKTTDDYMGPTDRIDEMRNDKEWAPLFPATAVQTQQQRHTASPVSRAQSEEVASIVQQFKDGNTRIR